MLGFLLRCGAQDLMKEAVAELSRDVVQQTIEGLVTRSVNLPLRSSLFEAICFLGVPGVCCSALCVTFVCVYPALQSASADFA
jgi:hypothetical protein